LLGDLQGFGVTIKAGEDGYGGLVDLNGGFVVAALVRVFRDNMGAYLFDKRERTLRVGECGVERVAAEEADTCACLERVGETASVGVSFAGFNGLCDRGVGSEKVAESAIEFCLLRVTSAALVVVAEIGCGPFKQGKAPAGVAGLVVEKAEIGFKKIDEWL